MTTPDLQSKLEALLALLQEEREMAKALDMTGLGLVVEKKQALLATLKPTADQVKGFEGLLRQIDQENRRNAFLLWTGLSWVREMMGFFGKAAMPQVYGDHGRARALTQGGRLLSGKV